MIVSSLFPTLFCNNAYLSCYLLFYPIHPLLNIVVDKLDKKSLFRIALVMFFLYCVIGFIREGFFFPSEMILWIAIYFVVAFIQRYMTDFCGDRRKICLLLGTSLAGFIGVIVTTNILGFRFPFFQNRMLYWVTNCNPFLIMAAVALFLLASNIHFRNAEINKLSSLSMLVYIIHENLILRTYYRPSMVNDVYRRFGYDHILLWVIILAVVIFAFGVTTSWIYDQTLRKQVRKGCEWVYPMIRKVYLAFECFVMKLH